MLSRRRCAIGAFSGINTVLHRTARNPWLHHQARPETPWRFINSVAILRVASVWGVMLVMPRCALISQCEVWNTVGQRPFWGSSPERWRFQRSVVETFIGSATTRRAGQTQPRSRHRVGVHRRLLFANSHTRIPGCARCASERAIPKMALASKAVRYREPTIGPTIDDEYMRCMSTQRIIRNPASLRRCASAGRIAGDGWRCGWLSKSGTPRRPRVSAHCRLATVYGRPRVHCRYFRRRLYRRCGFPRVAPAPAVR